MGTVIVEIETMVTTSIQGRKLLRSRPREFVEQLRIVGRNKTRRGGDNQEDGTVFIYMLRDSAYLTRL